MVPIEIIMAKSGDVSPVLTKESTHLLIHTASETVEHRTPAVFEFFDATASVSGAMARWGWRMKEWKGMNGRGWEMEKGGKHEVYIYYRYKHSTKHFMMFHQQKAENEYERTILHGDFNAMAADWDAGWIHDGRKITGDSHQWNGRRVGWSILEIVMAGWWWLEFSWVIYS